MNIHRAVSVTEESFLSRIMGSFFAAILGVVCFFGSFALLWWNEGNVIAEKGAYEEMGQQVVKINANKSSAKFNNKLVHGSAVLSSNQMLSDGEFLKPGKYLSLGRSVEMYQWVEHKETRKDKKVGGKTEKVTYYEYKLEWATGQVDSSKFYDPVGHENPTNPYQSKTYHVKSSKFGSFDGQSVLERKKSSMKSLSLNQNMIRNGKNGKVQAGALYIKNHSGVSNRLGDVRIKYRALKPGGTYSVMAKQLNPKKLGNWDTSNGKSKFLVENGKVGPKKMVQSAKDGASMMANILRIIGFIMMFAGITMILSPFTTFLDVLPFLGNASRFLVSVMAFVVAGVLSTVTIVVGMVAHNPIALGVVVLASAGGIFYVVKLAKDKKAAAQAQSQGQSQPQQPSQQQPPPPQASNM